MKVCFSDVCLSLGSDVSVLHTLKLFRSKDVTWIIGTWISLQKVDSSSQPPQTEWQVIRLQAANGSNGFMVCPLCIEAAHILCYRSKTLKFMQETF